MESNIMYHYLFKYGLLGVSILLTAISALSWFAVRISAGYIYQTVADNEAHRSGQGISLGTYVYLFRHLGIDLKTDFVMDNFQPDVRASWDFDKPKISFAIRYEKMPYLDQLTACLQYRLSY